MMFKKVDPKQVQLTLDQIDLLYEPYAQTLKYQYPSFTISNLFQDQNPDEYFTPEWAEKDGKQLIPSAKLKSFNIFKKQFKLNHFNAEGQMISEIIDLPTKLAGYMLEYIKDNDEKIPIFFRILKDGTSRYLISMVINKIIFSNVKNKRMWSKLHINLSETIVSEYLFFADSLSGKHHDNQV